MNLYIYIEILEREFLSKLLIGMESASKGIKVYMGRLNSYIKRDFLYGYCYRYCKYNQIG